MKPAMSIVQAEGKGVAVTDTLSRIGSMLISRTDCH